MKNILAFPFGKLVNRHRGSGALGAAMVCLIGLFCLNGCLSRPALKTETFSFDTPAFAGANPRVTAPVLGIKAITVAAPFADRPLVFRTGEFSYERDPYAAFLDFPDKELMAPIRAGLGSQGDFRAVVRADGMVEPDIIVEINVSQLFGDFRQRDKAEAILRAQFIFCRATNGIAGGMILQKEYSRSIPLAKPTAAALMAGWNQALGGILREVLSDYRQRKE